MFAGSLFSSAPWAHKHHNPKNVRSKKTKKDRKCWQKRPKKTENAGKKDQKRPKKTKKDTSKKTQKRHCHNTGCEVMRRFSMVGTLVRDVHGMERAGRILSTMILGCDVLCNRLCFTEAECEHEMRLIPCRVEVSATSDTPEVAAELLLNIAASGHPAEEWMYQIGKSSEWDNYNTTVRKYLKGDASAAAVEEAAQGCPCERSPLNVHPSTVKGGLLSVALARPLRERIECQKTTLTGKCHDTLSECTGVKGCRKDCIETI